MIEAAEQLKAMYSACVRSKAVELRILVENCEEKELAMIVRRELYNMIAGIDKKHNIEKDKKK